MTRHPRRTPTHEDGQIAVLVLGLFVIVLVFILGAIDVTAAQLARIRLLDTADSIALDAADAVDPATVYAGGVDQHLGLTDETVHAAAVARLAGTPIPSGVTEWALVAPTGTPDGVTAEVTVRGRATLPMTGWILESLGGGVTITVTSRARAPLR